MLKKRWSSSRSVRIEALESRRVLTAGPLITGVELSSTDWPVEQFDYLKSMNLGARGVQLSGTDANLLGYSNLNQLVFNFDKPVVASVDSLSVFGVESGELLPDLFEQFEDDTVAVWTFDTPFDRDQLLHRSRWGQ